MIDETSLQLENYTLDVASSKFNRGEAKICGTNSNCTGEFSGKNGMHGIDALKDSQTYQWNEEKHQRRGTVFFKGDDNHFEEVQELNHVLKNNKTTIENTLNGNVSSTIIKFDGGFCRKKSVKNVNSIDSCESNFQRCRRIFDSGDGLLNKCHAKSLINRNPSDENIHKFEELSPINNQNEATNSINIVSIELEPSKATITSRLLVTPSPTALEHRIIPIKDYKSNHTKSTNLSNQTRSTNSSNNTKSTNSSNSSNPSNYFSSQMPSSSTSSVITKSKRCGITTVSIQAECHSEPQKESSLKNPQAPTTNLSSPSKVRQCLKRSTLVGVHNSPKPPVAPRASKLYARRELPDIPNGVNHWSHCGSGSNLRNRNVFNCEFQTSVSNSSACKSGSILSVNYPLETEISDALTNNYESEINITSEKGKNCNLKIDQEVINNFHNRNTINECSELNTSQNSDGFNSSGYSTLEDSRGKNDIPIVNDTEQELELTTFGEEVDKSRNNPKFRNYRSPRGKRSKRGSLSSKPVHVTYSTLEETFVNLGEISITDGQHSEYTLTCSGEISNNILASVEESRNNTEILDENNHLHNNYNHDNIRLFTNAASSVRTSNLHSRSTLPCVVEEPSSTNNYCCNASGDIGDESSSEQLERQMLVSKQQEEVGEATPPTEICSNHRKLVESKSFHFQPANSMCNTTGSAMGSSKFVRISALGHLHEESPGCCILSACPSAIYSTTMEGPNCCNWNKRKKITDEKCGQSEESTTRLGIISTPCSCSDIICRSTTPPLVTLISGNKSKLYLFNKFCSSIVQFRRW